MCVPRGVVERKREFKKSGGEQFERDREERREGGEFTRKNEMMESSRETRTREIDCHLEFR
jgi:hypothetical protein